MTSHDLQAILDRIIDREGGLVDHPSDPGGLTNFGISQRAYPNEDIRALTRERAKFLYLRDYIFKHHLERLDDPALVENMVDWIINGGPAIKSLQRLIGVTPDGVVGPDTIAAANRATLEKPNLVASLLRKRLLYFASLTKHPFIMGWINRLFKLGL